MIAATATGPESLPQLEDRVLYHLVELTGDHPLPLGEGVSEAALAERLAEELGIAPDFAQSDEFYGSSARGTVLAAVKALEDEGLLEAIKVMGPWTIRPTRDGRRRVDQWRQQWRQAQDRAVQRRILEELERCWRADPGHYAYTSRLDVERLCADLGVPREDYLANAQRLLAQGKIAENELDQASLADGYAHITEAGRRDLEVASGTPRPSPGAQEAWVEVARLRRRLQLAERNLSSLIADDELRRRCQDLLAAEGHYDRVIREACVILEDRVRTAISADKSVVGTALMEAAFGPRAGPLRLSGSDQEQRGAMELYRGVMAFFRNTAGHNVIETYNQDDAVRFVVLIDLLLGMVRAATSQAPDLQANAQIGS